MCFNINDRVVHSNGGVFVINEMKIMNCGGSDINYYCLKPYSIEPKDDTLVIYVPEGKADDLLRPLLNKQEANELMEKIKTIDAIWFNDVKERKNKFAELCKSRIPANICVVLKSLYVQQKKLSEENRFLNLIDYDYLKKIKKGLEQELAIVLDRPVGDIENYILSVIN